MREQRAMGGFLFFLFVRNPLNAGLGVCRTPRCKRKCCVIELTSTAARQKVKLETQDLTGSADLCWLHTVRIYTFLPEHKPQLKQPNKTQNLGESAPLSCDVRRFHESRGTFPEG